MVKVVAQKRAELEQLCHQFHVERLGLFGSATTNAFDAEQSDLDFLVRFHQPAPAPLFDLYFDLSEALEMLFNRKVDLVMEGALKNPYFIGPRALVETMHFSARL